MTWDPDLGCPLHFGQPYEQCPECEHSKASARSELRFCDLCRCYYFEDEAHFCDGE